MIMTNWKLPKTPYLDPATRDLLWHLILNEGQIDINLYLKSCIGGEYDVVKSDILRIEKASKKDTKLKIWKEKVEEMMSSHHDMLSKKYQYMKGDVARNIEADKMHNFWKVDYDR